jgi:hypothetical protein
MVERAKYEGPDRRSESSRSEVSGVRIEAPAPVVEEGPSGPRAGFWVRFTQC